MEEDYLKLELKTREASESFEEAKVKAYFSCQSSKAAWWKEEWWVLLRQSEHMSKPERARLGSALEVI